VLRTSVDWRSQRQEQQRVIPLDRKLTEQELAVLKAKAEARGYPHVVDTGQGVTLTKFGEGPVALPEPLSRPGQ
jgi:hypothetical protein